MKLSVLLFSLFAFKAMAADTQASKGSVLLDGSVAICEENADLNRPAFHYAITSETSESIGVTLQHVVCARTESGKYGWSVVPFSEKVTYQANPGEFFQRRFTEVQLVVANFEGTSVVGKIGMDLGRNSQVVQFSKKEFSSGRLTLAVQGIVQVLNMKDEVIYEESYVGGNFGIIIK